ncbi:MAG: hypothetical protein KYX69_22030 [Sphingomonas sp.]|uniref:hypothetical protein n=1 Tax=Sphingomonas sp. TaxID=28214 RepID=UPI002632FFB3|nr:hypothetical protein [Sphingomonas sp.]MDK2770388.1 hypothetical protein [Sphingomonas sp.]
MVIGICKLTGETGPLVKSHIIPKALTSPDEKGRPFAQAGRDYPPRKRRDSWYDAELVTRIGEDILAEYDSWGIEVLRRNRLVWSGFGTSDGPPEDDMLLLPGSDGAGVRKIAGIDGSRLRLFLLSILWRAAASSLPEFKAVRMLPAELRRLGRMVRDGRHEPAHFFPVSLTQLTTRGQVHNHAPIAQRKLRDPTKPDGGSIPIFRFYFDGLIAHFHRKGRARDVAALGPLIVGGADNLAVVVRPYDGSWQEANLLALISEAESRWPERLEKIYRG